jgi:chitodextrinase
VTPTVASQADPQPIEVGVRFRSSSDGYITGLRFYKGPANTGTHIGKVWSSTGTLLASVIFTGESGSGWQQVKLPRAVAIRANTTYVASYHTEVGGYAIDENGFAASGVDNPPLRALRDGEDGPNGVYQYGPGGFPTQTSRSSNYWVDVVFDTIPPPDQITDGVGDSLPRTCPCSVWDDAATPTVASNDDAQAIEVGFRFRSEADGYITGLRFYKGPANTGTHVGKLWTNTGELLASAMFSSESASGWQQVGLSTPVAIRAGTTYVASYHSNVGGYARDLDYFGSGVDNPPLRALRDGEDGPNGVYVYGPGGFPTLTFGSSNYWVDVVFDTVALPASSPDATAPSAPSSLTATAISTSQIDLTWTASTDDIAVTGYRVERCQGAGCSNFTQVASPSSTSYSDTGLLAGTSYTYRVRATDAAGNLGPYSNSASATTNAEPDTAVPTAPSNLAATPAGTSRIDLAWTASTDNVGVTGYRVERCQGPGCTDFAQVASPTGAAYSDTGLVAATSYSYRVRAADAAGNLSPYSNTTSATTNAPQTCPCRIWNDAATPTVASQDDVQPVEVGLRFRSSTDGYITGLRFYKGPANNGTHTGKLWTNAGTLLASVTFTGESASGWQQMNLPTPVAITASTTYVASYHTDAGGYAIDQGYFGASGFDNSPLRALRDGEDGANGVYAYGPGGFPTQTANSSNYWVDVVFDTIAPPPADTTPPTAPSALSATAISSSRIDLAWTASTDNVGVTGYRVDRCQGAGCGDFTQVASPSGTTFSDAGLLPATSYSYRVRATDAAGNLSSYSNTAGATTDAAQPSGLAAAYSFDAGSGAEAADASGMGNTGAISGAGWTTQGRYGNALSFDGVDDWVTVNDAASLDLTTGMTLEAWLFPTALSGWQTAVLKEQSGHLAYAMYANTDGGQPSGEVFTTSGSSVRGPASLPLNAWTHVAVTYDGAVLALYVSGTLVASGAASGSITTTTGALRIGGNGVWGEYFQGLIDEVRIYNRALTAGEIQTDMNTPIGSL